jgi:hypothetical protein
VFDNRPVTNMLDQIYRHELAWRISGVAIKQSPPGLIGSGR